MRHFALIALSTIAASVGARIYLVIWLDRGIGGWAEADLISSAIPFLLAVAIVRTSPSEVSRGSLRRLAAFVLPLIPHRIAFWALGSLDRIALGAVASLHEVGVYALAASLASAVTAVIAEINHSVLVEYSRARPPLPPPRLARIATWQIVVAISVPTLAIVGVTTLEGFLVPSAYGGVVAIFAILMIGQVTYGLYVIPMNLLTQASGITGISWIGSCSGAAIVFLGALAFGSRWGSTAMAVANCVGYLTMATVAVALFSYYKIPVRWKVLSFGPVVTGALLSSLGLALLSAWREGWMTWFFGACALVLAGISTWIMSSRAR